MELCGLTQKLKFWISKKIPKIFFKKCQKYQNFKIQMPKCQNGFQKKLDKFENSFLKINSWFKLHKFEFSILKWHFKTKKLYFPPKNCFFSLFFWTAKMKMAFFDYELLKLHFFLIRTHGNRTLFSPKNQ